MKIEIKTIDNNTYLAVRERIEFADCIELERIVAGNLADKKNNLILDFKDLIYIDSAALSVLITQAKTYNHHDRRIVVSVASNYVRSIMSVTRIANYIPIYVSLAEATEALRDFESDQKK